MLLLLSNMFMPTSRVLDLSPGNTVSIHVSLPVSLVFTIAITFTFSGPLIMLSPLVLFSLLISVLSVATRRRSQRVCGGGRLVGQNLVHGRGDAVYERPFLIAGPGEPLAEAHATLGLGFAETNGKRGIVKQRFV